jgi:hypothetical protein
MKTTVIRIYMLVLLGLCLFLLFALSVFEILPLTQKPDDQVKQVYLQLARHEFLVKTVYALAYRSSVSRAQSISDLQIQLPQYEQVQIGLLKGNAALNLPGNPSDAVRGQMAAASGDYLATDTAIKTMLAHPDKDPDPLQVTIVAQHDRAYLSTMYGVMVLMEQEAQARLFRLFVIRMSLVAAVFVLVIVKYTVLTQNVVKTLLDEENAHETRVGETHS